MNKIHKSGEDYLETILVLSQKQPEVRSIDIAHEMEVSKPSVCNAMKLLKSGGMVKVDDGGFITLTESGMEVASAVYEKHRVLTDWLIDIGVTDKTAAEDACKMEHDISSESFAKLKEHIRTQHKNSKIRWEL